MEKKLFSRLVSGSVARPLSPIHQLFSYSREKKKKKKYLPDFITLY
jgi:hypothetical protein